MEHETQKINGLGIYNVHSLMWERNAKQQRGQGGVACLIRKGCEAFISTVKNDKHKRYIWLKIMTCSDVPTFVAGCYTPHHDSSFYAYIDQDQPFLDLEEDIAYFKSKGKVIVMGDMNA